MQRIPRHGVAVRKDASPPRHGGSDGIDLAGVVWASRRLKSGGDEEGVPLAALESELPDLPPSPLVPPSSTSSAVPAGTDPAAAEWRTRFEAMYRRYHPEGLPGVPLLLSSCRGQESVMMLALTRKYGPEPPLSAPPQQQQAGAAGGAPIQQGVLYCARSTSASSSALSSLPVTEDGVLQLHANWQNPAERRSVLRYAKAVLAPHVEAALLSKLEVRRVVGATVGSWMLANSSFDDGDKDTLRRMLLAAAAAQSGGTAHAPPSPAEEETAAPVPVLGQAGGGGGGGGGGGDEGEDEGADEAASGPSQEILEYMCCAESVAQASANLREQARAEAEGRGNPPPEGGGVRASAGEGPLAAAVLQHFLGPLPNEQRVELLQTLAARAVEDHLARARRRGRQSGQPEQELPPLPPLPPPLPPFAVGQRVVVDGFGLGTVCGVIGVGASDDTATHPRVDVALEAAGLVTLRSYASIHALPQEVFQLRDALA